MKDNVFCNDYYEISGDYRLLVFNQTVVDIYPGVKVGDKCYEVIMKREAPCLHCPVAGNSDCDCPVYYDPCMRTGGKRFLPESVKIDTRSSTGRPWIGECGFLIPWGGMATRI